MPTSLPGFKAKGVHIGTREEGKSENMFGRCFVGRFLVDKDGGMFVVV